MPYSFRGRHLLVDFFGVDPVKLRNCRGLMRVMRAALKKAGFQIIGAAGSHQFKTGGQGVTGFILLSESHAAFHSYPEAGYIALDVYSCGKCDPRPVAAALEAYLVPQKVTRALKKRGL